MKINNLPRLFPEKVYNELNRILSVLSKPARKKIVILTLIQILLSGLDLLAILCVGVVGSVSKFSANSGENNGALYSLFQILNLQTLSQRNQYLIIIVSILVLLISRTILSVYFARKTLFFLSRSAAETSRNLLSRLLYQSIFKIQSRTNQDHLYSITVGVERLFLQVIAVSVVWISDFAILVVLTLGLFFIDPFVSFLSFILLLLPVFFLHLTLNKRVQEISASATNLSIKSNEKVIEVFSTLREAIVQNRREFYANEIWKIRTSLATISAELNFIPYVNKYIIEASVIVTAVMIGGIQYYLDGTESAISTLTVFLAAGSRIAPALLRIQQGTISIKNGLGVADPFFQLLEMLEIKKVEPSQKVVGSGSFGSFIPSIKLSGVSFSYPGTQKKALIDIHLSIEPGESCAIAGPSGAGKSTMADLILGIIEPAEGVIEIANSDPLEVFAKWSGQVSYVPQDITLIKGTISENISLGYLEGTDTTEKVMSALETAQLLEFVSSLPEGINTQIGERGAKLSGGQRQRIGLARALFTKPKLLVLDEATSALDVETEAAITRAISELKGQTTIVVIAHRLDTIRKLDQIVFLRDGKIVCKGSYEEVSGVVPELRG